MLKPVLAHHRREYDRLGRLQVKTAILGALFLMLFGLVALVVREQWTLWLMMLPLVAEAAGLGVLTVRMLAVFHRDLEDRARPPQ